MPQTECYKVRNSASVFSKVRNGTGIGRTPSEFVRLIRHTVGIRALLSRGWIASGGINEKSSLHTNLERFCVMVDAEMPDLYQHRYTAM